VRRYLTQELENVTSAEFVMVALDAMGRPTPIPEEA